jgi:actin-related protein
MEEESKTVIVIDNGSHTIKAGFAGDDAPRKIFPSAVGYTKKHPINLALDEKSYYVGYDAKERRGRLEMRKPICDSLVQNWEDIENLWSYTIFNVLKICPDEVFAVITESPTNPAKYREKSLETLFELFNFEGVYLASKSLLSLYSTGKTTGCVIDSGYGSSYTVPIYEGYSSPNTIQELELGGRHLDDYLNKILLEKGYEFTTPLELELLSEIKQKLCTIQKDKKDHSIESKTYCLPDDTVVRLHKERYEVPEAIFDPSRIGINKSGLHDCCFKSVMKTMTDIRNEMFSNIVLAGGNTMFENYKSRMEAELRQLFPFKTEINIDQREERMYSSWIGGSIIGNMDTFQHLCISRKEFEEQGVRIVHNKTF